MPRPVHFLGVGNSLRRDDGVGIVVAASLRRALARRRSAGVVHDQSGFPESELSRIPVGAGVVIFDAIEARVAPGSIACAPLGDTKYGFFVTHNVPLRLIPGIAGRKDVFVIGIEPESVEFGEGLSPRVRSSADALVVDIRELVVHQG